MMLLRKATYDRMFGKRGDVRARLRLRLDQQVRGSRGLESDVTSTIECGSSPSLLLDLLRIESLRNLHASFLVQQHQGLGRHMEM